MTAVRKPRPATLRWIAGVIFALLVAGMAFWALRSARAANDRLATSNREMASRQAARDTVIRKLSTGLDTTRGQLQHLGVTPSAPPARSIVGGVPGVPGAAGVQGVPGAAGSPGARGVPGPASTVPGPAGSPGPASTVPGPQGVQGVPGADSTVPGPKGDQGTPGKDGANGTDGRDGAPGQPPAGWTYRWTDSTGTTHQVTCTRTADSPDSAPMYDCADTTPTPTPSPSPSPTGSGLLGVGMLTASATYRRL